MWDYHAFGTYLAVGDNRLVSRFGFAYPQHTPGYALHLAARLPRETYDGQRFEPATHSLAMVWFDLTAETIRAAVNAAMQAIVPGAIWSFRAADSTLTVTTTVLDVTASEPYACDVNGRPATEVAFSIKTRPGWRAPAVTITPTGATTLPHVYTVPGVAGSMPCPVRLTHTHDQATSKQALGIRHSPAATAGLIQDYQGAADTDALSGQSAIGTMDADGVALGTPTSLDSNLYRGWYMAACRVEQPDATPADTTYFATVTTTGSGVAESTTFVTESVPATVANAYEIVYLGPFPIPAGQVPNVDTGSGFGASTLIASQTDHPRGILLNDISQVGQTFPLTSGYRVDSISVLIGTKTGVSTGLWLWTMWSAPGDVPTDVLAVGIVTLTSLAENSISVGCVAPATAQYAFTLQPATDFEAEVEYDNAGGYADGKKVKRLNGAGSWTEDDAEDLYFKLYASAPLGFTTTVAISAANAGAGTALLDTVALIPYDEWSAISSLSCDATEGIMLDAEDDEEPVGYLYKADGSIGPVSQTGVDWQGMPVIWPGESAIVVAAQTPDDPPTGSDLIATYWPTYLTPYGG